MKKFVTFVAVTLAIALAGYSQSRTDNSQNSQVRGVKYQPLNVKPGLWEKTWTSTIAGELPIPAEMLSKLTPEQRARMEERMKANSAAHTRTSTDKECITKQDLEKPLGDKDTQCVWTILESTSSKAKGNVSCQTQGMKMAGTGEFDAPDQEHLNGSMHTSSNGGGHNMTADITFTSKWLSSSCGNLKRD